MSIFPKSKVTRVLKVHHQTKLVLWGAVPRWTSLHLLLLMTKEKHGLILSIANPIAECHLLTRYVPTFAMLDEG